MRGAAGKRGVDRIWCEADRRQRFARALADRIGRGRCLVAQAVEPCDGQGCRGRPKPLILARHQIAIGAKLRMNTHALGIMGDAAGHARGT